MFLYCSLSQNGETSLLEYDLFFLQAKCSACFHTENVILTRGIVIIIMHFIKVSRSYNKLKFTCFLV